MAFVFRLEKVRRHRKRQVDERARDVAVAARDVRQCELRLAELAADVRRLQEGPGSASGQAVDPVLMRDRSVWLRHLYEETAAARERLAAAEAEVARRRDVLTEAWRGVEVLNRLESRQKEAWLADRRRDESLAMDEIGQILSDRARREAIAG